MEDLPKDHPRVESLKDRHAIIDGMHKKIVAEAGLIAHGRGEAFDYLLGERTHGFAEIAIKAAAAEMKLASHPVYSVNGNVTALCGKSIVDFSLSCQIPLEINLFYRSAERIVAISEELHQHGEIELLGTNSEDYTYIEELSSQRRIVDQHGIWMADVVFVPLEDGDRTEALVKSGKKVITVDLNPLSRTAQKAHITIVDNIKRVMPLLTSQFQEMSIDEAKQILAEYDNKSVLEDSLLTMSKYWRHKFS